MNVSKTNCISLHQAVGVSLNQTFENQEADVVFSNLSVLQGQSRRVQVEVKSVQESGTLPLMEECILSVGIGCVKVRPFRSPKIHETCHVSFCACSLLFQRQWPTRVFETLLPLPLLCH